MDSKEPQDVNLENPEDGIDFDADTDKSWQVWKILISVICFSVSGYIVKNMFFPGPPLPPPPELVQMNEIFQKIAELDKKAKAQEGEEKAETLRQIEAQREELKKYPNALAIPRLPPYSPTAEPAASPDPAAPASDE